MDTGFVSQKYEVLIPRTVGEKVGLRPGQEVQFIPDDNRIEVIPLRHPRELRGFAEGMNIDFEREPDRL
jgi:bifunctional DNA-binding transcriptional regulator/antitoxin component of YhaV-PrlF toxin-antitoxin module